MKVGEHTLAEIVQEAALGELAGAEPATIAEVVDAAREVEEELAAMLAQIGKPAAVHVRLKRALLRLDRELTR